MRQQALTFDASLQLESRAWLHAEGLCVICGRIYTAENPQTGQPFLCCVPCRMKA